MHCYYFHCNEVKKVKKSTHQAPSLSPAVAAYLRSAGSLSRACPTWPAAPVAGSAGGTRSGRNSFHTVLIVVKKSFHHFFFFFSSMHFCTHKVFNKNLLYQSKDRHIFWGYSLDKKKKKILYIDGDYLRGEEVLFEDTL